MEGIISRESLRGFFRKYLYPKQEHFYAWIDSFWHKKDTIPTESVDGLNDKLNDKLDVSTGNELRSQLDTIEGKTDNLNMAVDQLTVNLNDAEAVIEDHTVEIESLFGVSSTQHNRINSLETARGTHQGLINSLTARVGNNEGMIADHEDKIANLENMALAEVVEIYDFSTFDPSTDPVCSLLEVGQSCAFRSEGAYDSPNMVGQGFASVWTGRITKIYTDFYHLEAIPLLGIMSLPRSATRLYETVPGDFYVFDWQFDTEYTHYSGNGYTKLPSGLMIQWGQVTNAGAGATFSFPISFKSFYQMAMVGTNSTNDSIPVVPVVPSVSNSGFHLRAYWVTSSYGTSNYPCKYIAIGTWK